MSANGAFNLELILKTGNTRTEKGLYRKGPGRMPGPHTRKGPRLRRFLRCSPPGRHRHRTRVIRTAKFSTSGAMPCAASTTVASTHPAAVADHSGILTDRPISEGSKATDCMMELPGTLTRCSSGKSGARSNSNGSLPLLDFTHFKRHKRGNLQYDGTEWRGVSVHRSWRSIVKNPPTPTTSGYAQR